jgi:hypothetical protein
MSENTEKRVAVAKVTDEGTVLTFAFGNGNTHNVDVATFTPELQAKGLLHGIEQKLRDCYAGCKGDVAVAEALFLKVLDGLMSGEWSSRREGGASESTMEQLARAIVNAWAAKGKTKDYDAVLGEVKSMSKEQRADARSIEAVAIELAKLKSKATALDGELFEGL